MKPLYPDIADKVVVVTGAARGIGRAIALEFARHKAKIIIDDLPEREELLEEVRKELEATGIAVIAVVADVRKESDVKTLVEKSIAKFGRIDVLVNNAGIVYDIDWDKKTEDQWHDTLATNLVGPYLLIREARQYLLDAKGVVVNISSTNAYKAMNPFSLDYDASKAGLITLTQNMAKALAPDVRVNAVAPGWVDTDMNTELSPEVLQNETAKIFKKRFASADEIASVVAFLASQGARYINGTTITVDGGYQ
ncbi:MAG: glucose 1-dehydrogenase [Patescibacteria group bacterium]